MTDNQDQPNAPTPAAESAGSGSHPSVCCVSVAKMPFETHYFRENQKVWLQFLSGALFARVTGKFRGRGRYVSAWIRWGSKSKPNVTFSEIEVDSNFAERHKLARHNTKFSHDGSATSGIASNDCSSS